MLIQLKITKVSLNMTQFVSSKLEEFTSKSTLRFLLILTSKLNESSSNRGLSYLEVACCVSSIRHRQSKLTNLSEQKVDLLD